MKALLLMLGVLFMALAFTACDDSSDDDDNDDNDNDVSPEPYSWPDNPGPVVGWFAKWRVSEWELYKISDNVITTEDVPGSDLFIGGALAKPHSGLAVSINQVFELTDAGWNLVTDGPVCDSFFSQPFISHEGDMVIGCAEPSGRWYRIDGVWEFVPMAGKVIGKMECLDIDHCAFWWHQVALICSRSECEETAELPPQMAAHKQYIWRDKGRLYALLAEIGDDPFFSPYQYNLQTKEWKNESRISGAYDGYFARIIEKYFAYSRQGDQEGVSILEGDNGLIETDWPYMPKLAFAPNGGGIGISSTTGDVCILIGTDLVPIITNTGGSTQDFFVVADAE